MNVLITGASGFLGRHLKKHLNGDYQVMLLNRDGSISSTNGQIIFSEMNAIVWNPDVIVMAHAAVASGNIQLSNSDLFDGNVAYTERVMSRFPGVHIIYASTVSVYQIQTATYYEGSTVSPLTPYAISKWWGERVVQENASYTIIRFPSLYGIGMKENTIIPNYINSALQHGVIKVWGDGRRLQNYLHVDDACGYINAALAQVASINKRILLGVTAQSYSNRELANIVANYCGAQVDYVNQDYSPSFEYDNNVTRRLLSFEPKKDFKSGIQEYLAWKKNQ